ncbi:MAG: gamma-glutamylcyclotransferase [Proteobacteria bacterium]|jgi:glutathione-specific gamma-glutamylcyclotransferase|nr:gamma-glutamylcyclotransferase [Pseudomonadota bacterium]MDA1286628.1 gamma-glutamylcyclotransferase [Pseudomonadota bacterium]
MTQNGFWVFGYGSLLWQPGFPFSDQKIARLQGYARSFCMRSIHHRGSVEEPGLVLALDRVAGAYCDGLAFFVEPKDAEVTITYLRERELISSAYLEEVHLVEFRVGEFVDAVCYVIDDAHTQYCGGLQLEEQASIIAQAVGGRGPNTEYLYNTAAHLRDLGIEDADLNWLEARVKILAGAV